MLFTYFFDICNMIRITTRMPCPFCTVQRLRDLQDAFNEGEWLRGIIYFSSQLLLIYSSGRFAFLDLLCLALALL